MGSGAEFGGDGPDELLARLAELAGTSPETVLDALRGAGQEIVGPVRRPSDREVAASVGRSRTLGQVGALAAACSRPGLALADGGDGDIGIADARRLVAELGTDDAAERAASAADLPELDRLIGVALAAGALGRAGGRLVADDGFAGLPPVEAYGRVVRAAFEVGLADEAGDDDLAEVLLARVLDEGDAGIRADALLDSIVDVDDLLEEESPAGVVQDRSEPVLERLLDLGLLDRGPGDVITGSAAGRAVGAEVLAEAGTEVVWRADPATADARALVASLAALDEEAAAADLAAWWAAHPGGARELVAAAVDDRFAAGAVLSLLELAASVLGPPVEAGAAAHRDGRHGSLVTVWLLTRGALDPAVVDPAQMLDGTVEIAAAMLDDAGPDGVVEFFDTDPEQTAEVLEHLWRAGNERTADVLDALGRHHPDRKVAKAARRSLMKLRNR